MYHADSEEKRRKSLLSNTTCLETISEGRQQRALTEKVMKSKGVQVSRNFEDSLRRYHPTPQRSKSKSIANRLSNLIPENSFHAASSQSSIESIPRTTKFSSLSSAASRTKRTATTKSGESTATSTSTKSSASRKRENGANSDGSKQRIHRVSSRERMHQSNASSSEDLPNSSAEAPRRPRRTKIVKHKDENGKDEKKSTTVGRSTRNGTSESSNARKTSSHGSISRGE